MSAAHEWASKPARKEVVTNVRVDSPIVQRGIVRWFQSFKESAKICPMMAAIVAEMTRIMSLTDSDRRIR